MKFLENIKPLCDADVYFIGKKLNLNNTLGLFFDYEELNKDEKVAIEKFSNDYCIENKILASNFFGETEVSEEYAEIVKFFCSAEYCICMSTINYCKKTSERRKLYYKDNKWLLCEYISDSNFVVAELENKDEAEKYFFGSFNDLDCEELIEVNYKENYDFETLKNVALNVAYISEFYMNNEGKFVTKENMYARLKDNKTASLKATEDGMINLLEDDKILSIDWEA